MIKVFVLGILATVVVGVAGAYVFVVTGAMPANADSPPSALERWMAHTSLHATIHREAPKGANPQAVTEANLTAGVKLYATNCAVCHGAADGQASNVALGLYQHAPQLAQHGVEDDPDGEIYWKIDHGIRLTGMPAFSQTLSDDQIWQVALFLKHMDKLPPAAEQAWKALPSVSDHARR